MARRIAFLAAVLTLLVASLPAHAQDVPRVDTRNDILFRPPGTAQPEAAPKAPRTTWYGWQILLADIASLATATQVPAYGLVLGGPAIHALHGQRKKAWQSFGLRLGLPFAGALVGLAAVEESCDRSGCGGGMQALAGMALGAAAGWVTAAIVDITYLARKPSKVSRELRKIQRMPVQPSISMVEGGAVLGVGSAF
jgi:hypothetical protein